MLMKHHRGGWHNATEEEAVLMEAAGWVRSSEEERRKEIEAKRTALLGENTTQQEPDIDGLRAQWQIKFGAAPHHRKTADTLRRELEE